MEVFKLKYGRIMFPDRAEAIRVNTKLRTGYRIFLDYWSDFIVFLKSSYEKVAERQASYALIVYGEQGVGKTLLADKLVNDYNRTKEMIDKSELEYDSNNIWHIISCGHKKSIEMIKEATQITDLIDLTDKENWVSDLKEWGKKNNNPKVVILDNAERAYFGASLAGIDEFTFFEKKQSSALGIHVAQQFVKLARSDMKGTLFIILGNDKEYLETFNQTTESQHKDMTLLKTLPLPSQEQKEAIVRINVNRLNSTSYWACIDKCGPDMKTTLYNKLSGTSTFPDSFNAVEEAFNESFQRIGRPANKSLITLVVITKDNSSSNSIARFISNDKKSNYEIVFENTVASLYYITSDFCKKVVNGSKDESAMLESEFTLRLLILSNHWVSQLLGTLQAQIEAIECLKLLLQHPKIGQKIAARDLLIKQQNDSSEQLKHNTGSASTVELDNFWKLGARRSTVYEPILSKYFAGYNKAFCKSFNKRPDVLLCEYKPCSVLSALSCDAKEINISIVRDCHAVEFTAIQDLKIEHISKYLSDKLPNYIELVKEL